MGWPSTDRGRRAVKVYIDVYDGIKPFEWGERWDTYIDSELDSEIYGCRKTRKRKKRV